MNLKSKILALPLPEAWITDDRKDTQPEARLHFAEDQMRDLLNAAAALVAASEAELDHALSAARHEAENANVWRERALKAEAQGEQKPVIVSGKRMIPDAECVQSKCACPTTGCWGECNMRRNPVVYAITAPQPLADERLRAALDCIRDTAANMAALLDHAEETATKRNDALLAGMLGALSAQAKIICRLPSLAAIPAPGVAK